MEGGMSDDPREYVIDNKTGRAHREPTAIEKAFTWTKLQWAIFIVGFYLVLFGLSVALMFIIRALQYLFVA